MFRRGRPPCGVQVRQAPAWDSGPQTGDRSGRPQEGTQARQAPLEISGPKVGIRTSRPQSVILVIAMHNPRTKPGTQVLTCYVTSHESFDEWANEQAKEHHLGNLVDYELFKEIESARRMEESRLGPHENSWPLSPVSAFREPVYRDYDK